MSELRNVAVVLAGGTGSRIGAALPKQLLTIAGRPIIDHAIAAFQDSPLIDEIVVVMVPGQLEAVREIVRAGGHVKVSQVIEGGATRNESTRLALAALGSQECNVLLHDAARPLVPQTVIGAVIAALETYEAVDTAIPSADTVVVVDPGVDGAPDTISEVLDRGRLRRVQTPQAFRLSVIRRAHELATRAAGGTTVTDDCTMVLRHLPEVGVAVVAGDPRNLKVTEPVDVLLAEQLLLGETPEPSRPNPADRVDEGERRE